MSVDILVFGLLIFLGDVSDAFQTKTKHGIFTPRLGHVDWSIPSAKDITMATTDWPSFLVKFCGRHCQNGTLVVQPNLCTNPQCFPCDCHKLCSEIGTCCPTLDVDTGKFSYQLPESNPESYLYEIYKRMACMRPFFDGFKYNYLNMLTVVKCPASWNDSDISNKCENPTYDSMDSILSYIDYNTGLVFWNIFCVLCHDLDPYSVDNDNDTGGLQVLPVIVRCKLRNLLTYNRDVFQVYSRLGREPTCIATYTVDVPTRYCEYDPTYITTSPEFAVNATEKLKEICLSLPLLPALSVTNQKNIFCLLGSERRNMDWNDNCDFQREPRPVPSYFNSLPEFVISKENEPPVGKTRLLCLHCSWNNRTVCSPIKCPYHKVLVDEDTCKAKIVDLNGLRYRLNVILEPLEPIPGNLFDKGFKVFNGITQFDDEKFFVNKIFKTKKCTRGSGRSEYKQEIDMEIKLDATTRLNIDEFDRQMIQTLSNSSWNVEVEATERTSRIEVKLRVVCYGKELCDIYRSYSQGDSTCVDVSETVINSNFWPKVFHEDLTGYDIDVTPLLACPYIPLYLESKPFVEDSNIVFAVSMGNESINIINNGYISIVEGMYFMCVPAMKELFQQLEERVNQTNVFNTANHNTMFMTFEDAGYLYSIFVITWCVFLIQQTITPCL